MNTTIFLNILTIGLCLYNLNALAKINKKCSESPKFDAEKIKLTTKDHFKAAKFLRQEIAKGCDELELMFILHDLKQEHLAKEFPEVDLKIIEKKTQEYGHPYPYGLYLMELKKKDEVIPALILESSYLSMTAQTVLWNVYQWGIEDTIPEHDPRILKFYQELANEGHPRIEYNMGKIYAEGIGQKKNLKKAISWFKKSILPDAKIELGSLYLYELKDHTRAENAYLEAVKENAEAAYYLGVIYREQKKYDLAFKYFTLRNKDAPDEAQTIVNLGQMTLEGWGTPMNCELGKKFYHDAADRLNFEFAKNSLKYYYDHSSDPKFSCFVKNTITQPPK